MIELSEIEIQTLICMIELEEPLNTDNNNGYAFFPKTVDDAKKYFRKYALRSPDDGYELLAIKGLAEGTENNFRLTSYGSEMAKQIRMERPPIWYWYKEYYEAVKTSRAHSEFCKTLFGMNLSQDGFSDMDQINRMLDMAHISSKSKMKSLYEKEGNGFLFDSILEQSVEGDLPYNERTCIYRRYLYVVRKD